MRANLCALTTQSCAVKRKRPCQTPEATTKQQRCCKCVPRPAKGRLNGCAAPPRLGSRASVQDSGWPRILEQLPFELSIGLSLSQPLSVPLYVSLPLGADAGDLLTAWAAQSCKAWGSTEHRFTQTISHDDPNLTFSQHFRAACPGELSESLPPWYAPISHADPRQQSSTCKSTIYTHALSYLHLQRER